MSDATGAMSVRTAPLGPAFDLLGAFEPDGMFFEHHGSGLAATGLGVPVGADALAALRPGELAVGSIPFEPDGPASFWVPERVARRGRDGAATLVERGEVEAFVPSPRVSAAIPHEPLAGLALRPVPSPQDYGDAVALAVERIRDGELRKVVLSRTIEVTADRVFDVAKLLGHLRAVEPHCYVFAVPAGGGMTLVGASPELLVSRFGNQVRSNPLAGSAPRSGDPAEDRANADALLASTKDQQEHAIVVEAIAQALGPFCAALDWDPMPALRETANVWHLSTAFRGELREPLPPVTELVVALHPTPAVGGAPRAEALAVIRELEPVARGGYAGPVGWIDGNGDGEWAIALRCAEIRGRRATLYAGAGIVADSDPSEEIDETDRKFRAFLDSLRWG